MSKILPVLEASTAAEMKIESLFNSVLHRIHLLNQRLAQLVVAIRQSQSKDNSICLELYPCSSDGCRGCPHPRWVKYKWRPKLRAEAEKDILVSINLSAAKKEPILALSRKAKNYAQTAELIREAKFLLNERTHIIATLRTLEYAAKLHTTNNGG